jgi:predicted enzyme related to lactoylglutathione lyase
MADNPLARHGGLTYLHIPAADLRQSAEFYRSVLGWKIEDREHGLRFADRDGFLIGGFGVGPVQRDEGVVCYFYVDDIEAAVARAVAAGGEVVSPPAAEGDIQVARARDPAGNFIGLWQFTLSSG